MSLRDRVEPRDTNGAPVEDAPLEQLKRVARAEERALQFEHRLRETATDLLDANQALAGIPLLEFRMEELELEVARLRGERDALREENARFRDDDAALREENARLRDEQAALSEENARLRADGERLCARVGALEGSRSWRLLAPLRRVRALLRR